MPIERTSCEGENFIKEAEALLSEELSRLSFQDRNDITEEIHGVRVLAPEETPELIKRSLVELEVYLTEITTEPPSLKIAYNLSQGSDCNGIKANNGVLSHNRTYVNDASFRLRFLRCELFDAKKAALRIIKYLDLVLEIAGESALRRPIQLDDFSKKEMKILRSGYIQLLPYRDRAGRPILTYVGRMGFDHEDMKLKTKILLYTIYNAGGDVESQRKGLVHLVFPSNYFSLSSFSPNPTTRRLYKSVAECAPVRCCAVHLCLPNTFLIRMLRAFAVAVSSSSVRSRLKIYVATGVKKTYTVRGYGIPTELIPMTDTGNVKTAYLKQWIKLRLLLERETRSGVVNTDNEGRHLSIVELPGSCDVLYRTGTTTSSHPGNAVFRELIESKLEESQNQPELSFSIMADQLINEVQQIRKGRFLKWDNRGYWTRMDDSAQTTTKVTASIRDFKRLKEAKTNMQSIDSSTHIFVGQDLKRRKTSMKNNTFLMSAASTRVEAAEEHFSCCKPFVTK